MIYWDIAPTCVHCDFQMVFFLLRVAETEVICFADLSGVVNKLTDLLPVLVSCFQDLSPSIHSMAHVDVQSFDCMSFLLQSIDLVVRFFVHASGNNQHDFQNLAPAYKKKNLSISDQSISAVTLKKIWDEFPLSSNHCLSEKVQFPY